MTAQAGQLLLAGADRRRLTAVWLLGALLCAGCGSPTAPSPRLSTPTFVINAEPGVPQFDVDVVDELVSDVVLPYLASTFGWHPAQQIVITLQLRATASAAGSAEGVAHPNSITVDVGSIGWCCSAHNDAYRRKTIAHELFHVVQYSWGWLPLHARAAWLVEGTAEYVAYRAAVIDRGDSSADDVRACKQRGVLVSQPPIPTLANLDEPQQTYGLIARTSFVYADAYLAVERAVSRAGITSLMTFGQMSSPLADSFQAAFGQALADFYAEFERYRAGWQLAPIPPEGCY
ncbi:MAG: hypothetical protein ACM3SQ_01815 [Betaproteobacteria bacterium]